MGTSTFFAQKLWPDKVLKQITTETFAKNVWDQIPDLRAEFRTFSTFWNYCQGLNKGARRVADVTKQDEKRVLESLLGIRRGRETRLVKPRL